jgi:hypothetical protein
MSSTPPEVPVDPPHPELVIADTPEALLAAALAGAQGEFPAIAKTKTATVKIKGGGEYRYTYADVGDVLAAVRPVLARHGLALAQSTTLDDVLVTELLHVGGGTRRSEVRLGKTSASPQDYGGALTYLRRYQVVTVLGIAAEEDTDAQHVDTGRQQAAPPASPYAKAASDEEKRAALDALTLAIGNREVAKQYAATLVAGTGEPFPALVARWLTPLADWRGAAEARDSAAAPTDGPPVAADDYTGGPGAPAEDPPAETIADPVPDQSPQGDELAPDRAEDPGVPSEQPPLDLENPADPAAPAPGTIDPGDELAEAINDGSLEGLEGAEAGAMIDQLRALGCVCQHPLRRAGSSDVCPLRGHGIPF